MSGGAATKLVVLMALVFGTTVVGLIMFNPGAAPGEVLILDRATHVVFKSEHGDELWQGENIVLSQNWNSDVPIVVKRASGAIVAHYHLDFVVERPQSAFTLKIARVAQSVAIEINGTRIHTDHDERALERWGWYAPVAAGIPQGLLQEGLNRLVLRVTAVSGSVAGLSKVLLGDRATIETMAARSLLRQKDIPTYANFSVIIMSIPLLWIWWYGRGIEGNPFRNYGLLAVAAILFALRSMHVHVEHPPFPHSTWLFLVGASLGWSLGFFFSFLLHATNAGSARTDWALAGFIVLGTALLAFLPADRLAEYVPLFWYVPLAALGFLCAGIVCWKTIQKPDAGRIGLSLALLALLGAGIHDVMWAVGWRPFEAQLWMPIFMPAVLLAMMASVGNRFVQSWIAADALSRDLQRRVMEAEAGIAASYDRRLEAERQSALALERAGLVEDLHDGVGSKLSVLIATMQTSSLPKDRAIACLRDCLDDLRLVITARDQSSFSHGLADLSGQLGSLLQSSGITIDLRIEPAVDAVRLGPRRMLSLLRFVQEASANAARHGRGDQITIKCGLTIANLLRLEVIDGGNDRKADDVYPIISSGRGIATMKARGKRLGAKLRIEERIDGWSVSIDVPLQAGEVPESAIHSAESRAAGSLASGHLPGKVRQRIAAE